MAMGRPIITTDAPGCRETVKDNINGFLVPPFQYMEAVHAMEALLNERLRSDMGSQSRQYCESKFNVEHVNASMLKEMGVLE